jgi:L,D-transpeptidase ErfK/SrfK
MKPRLLLLLIALLAGGSWFFPDSSTGEEQFTAELKTYRYQFPDLTVVGSPSDYSVRAGSDNMLDIARRFGLGYNDMDLLYPRLDPWLPPPHKRLTIPSLWVLPPTQHQQLVINVPELRIYYFRSAEGTVQTYPIGIGDEGWETPIGNYHIVQKRPSPSWYIPASLQAKYGMAVMPPGPENPLGEFVMKFSAGAYGIHGTHMPWGVGRLVSHGCIRCYPEHIRILYPQVDVGTKLEIIYQPIKIGQVGDEVYVEAHPDVYNRIEDYAAYAMDMLNKSPQADRVDIKRFQLAINLQNGVPTKVTKYSRGTATRELSSRSNSTAIFE